MAWSMVVRVDEVKKNTPGMFLKSSQHDLLVVGYRYARESGVKDGANGLSFHFTKYSRLLRPHQETDCSRYSKQRKWSHRKAAGFREAPWRLAIAGRAQALKEDKVNRDYRLQCCAAASGRDTAQG